MLSRDQLLKSTIRTREIEISAGTVKVREMTGAERSRYLNLVNTEGNLEIPAQLQERLAAWCLVDESNCRLFGDNDLEAIGAMGGRDLELICLAILGVSGLTDDGFEELKKPSGAESVAPGSDLLVLSDAPLPKRKRG